MMKVIKKNQLTILVLALMLVTAGYLNYNANETVPTQSEIASIGDATLVGAAPVSNVGADDTSNVGAGEGSAQDRPLHAPARRGKCRGCTNRH